MTATTSQPETVDPGRPARKRREIDPEHDIDAKKTVVWLVVWTLSIFASLWLLLQLFKVVIADVRDTKIDAVQPVDLDELRQREEAILQGGRMTIQEAMEELVGR